MTTNTELLKTIAAARGIESLTRQPSRAEVLESQANARIRQSVITGYRYHKPKFDWAGHIAYTATVVAMLAVFYGIVELI